MLNKEKKLERLKDKERVLEVKLFEVQAKINELWKEITQTQQEKSK